MTNGPTHPAGDAIKACCADLYGSSWATLLLGDSFHPGGPALTEHLGLLLDLGPESRVLDVAAGRGTSAIQLARHFGCRVIGVDFSESSVAAAAAAARQAGVADQVQFAQGDAENLDFPDAAFDAVICECAFCTFPEKPVAAREIARVLRPEGRLGLSDLTREGPLPEDLQGLLAWVACLGDALPLTAYGDHFAEAGLTVTRVEAHDRVLRDLVDEARTKLLGAEMLAKLRQVELPGVDFAQAQAVARAAARAIETGGLGYGLIVAVKPAG